MSSHPLDHVINHAGYRFEFHTDHTKVFALDDPTGMPVEAFPAVTPALAEPPTTPYPGKVVFPESTPRCATECDPLPTASEARLQEQHASANAFKLWPEIGAAADPASECAAVRTLQRLGYTWSGGKEWKPPIAEGVTRGSIDNGALHKRLAQVEAYLARLDPYWTSHL